MPSPYERHTTFHPLDIIDERILRHGGKVEDHHVSQGHSRVKVGHRDMGELSLITNLTRLQYGYFHDCPAALIGFRFQFLGSNPHWRFQKADIKITFLATDADDGGVLGKKKKPEMDPVVVDFGPKHLASVGTEERRGWQYSATLSASATAAPPLVITPNASISAGANGSYSRHFIASVEGADFSDHGHTEPNIARFWLREDPCQKAGLPLHFDAAVIVKYSLPFSAAVDVKIGPVFDLLARPYSAAEPIVFQPGIDYGDSIRDGAGAVDFESLTQEEWRNMVTPNLDLGQPVLNSTAPLKSDE